MIITTNHVPTRFAQGAFVLAVFILFAAAPARADGASTDRLSFSLGPLLGAELAGREVGPLQVGAGAANVGAFAQLLGHGRWFAALDGAYVPLFDGVVDGQAVSAGAAHGTLSMGYAQPFSQDHRMLLGLAGGLTAAWAHHDELGSNSRVRWNGGVRVGYEIQTSQAIALGVRAELMAFHGASARAFATLGVRL